MNLPLTVQTPALWCDRTTLNLCELLNDHVHLEKKAANNAMKLLSYCPRKDLLDNWHKALIDVALEELQHMQRCYKLLRKHGGFMSLSHKNPYAQDLNALVRKAHTPDEHIDRLLVAALIEARSCERFVLLETSSLPQDITDFYRSLYHAEERHYRIFLKLASDLCCKEELSSRWDWFLQEEGRIIQQQPEGCRIHSWIP